jgi:hypothetical protein
MTLYNDPTVLWGGVEVGGIRISHMSDIDDDIEVKLTKTRGKKVLHVIKRLEPVTVDIDHAPTAEALKDNFAAAWKHYKDGPTRAVLKAAYDKRLAALTKPAAKTLDDYRQGVESAADAEAAQAVFDEAAKSLGADDLAELQKSFTMAWSQPT